MTNRETEHSSKLDFLDLDFYCSSPAPSSMAGTADALDMIGDSENENPDTPGAAASAVSASDAGLEAASAADLDAPFPWYTPDTPMPVKCYFPDCECEYDSMGKMLQHVQLRHKVKMKDIADSHLAKRGRKEISDMTKQM